MVAHQAAQLHYELQDRAFSLNSDIPSVTTRHTLPYFNQGIDERP